VLEIALTSGGVQKLEIYRRFRVPEVWFWRNAKIEIFALSKSGTYQVASKSPILPRLDITLLERCVGIQSWRQARETFRAA
jgi:Uma2 family endonuclease